MNILSFVKEYLEDRRGDWPQIADEAGVTYTWMTKVVQGAIANPGVRDIQKILDYIVSKGGIIKAIH